MTKFNDHHLEIDKNLLSEKIMQNSRSAQKKKMVVLVSPEGAKGGGGIGTVSNEIVAWMSKHSEDFSVKILDPRGTNRLTWPIRLICAIFEILRLRCIGQIDVLHLQVSERSSFVRKGIILLLGKLLGLPVILHHHGAELIPFLDSCSRVMLYFVRYVVRNANVNIVLGEKWKDYLVKSFELEPRQVYILYNAVKDFAPNKAAARSRQSMILLAANLSPRKGVTEFLKAIAILKDQGTEIRATLCGGGEIDRYRNLALELGVSELCTFKGWVDRAQVRSLMLTHTAFVLASFNEGLPMAILEALAARLPIITTPVGSIGEVLTDRTNCLLVTPGNETEIAIALSKLCVDKALAATLAANGRRLYEEKFQVNGYMLALSKLYHGDLVNS